MTRILQKDLYCESCDTPLRRTKARLHCHKRGNSEEEVCPQALAVSMRALYAQSLLRLWERVQQDKPVDVYPYRRKASYTVNAGGPVFLMFQQQPDKAYLVLSGPRPNRVRPNLWVLMDENGQPPYTCRGKPQTLDAHIAFKEKPRQCEVPALPTETVTRLCREIMRRIIPRSERRLPLEQQLAHIKMWAHDELQRMKKNAQSGSYLPQEDSV